MSVLQYPMKDYERLYKENAELRAQVEESKKDLEHYRSVENSLKNIAGVFDVERTTRN